jgi:hypothetical protein
MNTGYSPVNEDKARMNGKNSIQSLRGPHHGMIRPAGNLIIQSTAATGPLPSPPLPRYVSDHWA